MKTENSEHERENSTQPESDGNDEVEEIVETAKDRVEKYAAKAATKDGVEEAFFSGLRAAYAGVVEEYGDDEDFDEALRRGSNARNAALAGDDEEVSR